MISEHIGKLFNQIQVGISIIQDDNIIYANDELLSILGYSLEEIENKSFIHFSAKDEVDRLNRIKNEVEKLGISPKTIEFWIVSKDGKRKYIRNRYHPLKDEENKSLVVIQDISEDKKKETKVLASEFKKSRFLDYLTEQVIFYDTNLRIIWTNKSASDSLGMTSDQTIGEICHKVWYQKDTPCPDCPVIKARDTGQEQMSEVTTPDNRIWHVRGYPVYSDDDTLIGVAELASEFTEQRKSEIMLEESEEKYRLLFHNSNDIVAVVVLLEEEKQGKFLEVNDVACEKTGYSREEALEMKPTEVIEGLTEEILQSYYGDIRKKEFRTSEKFLVTKTGERIPVEIKASFFRLHNQPCVLVSARDIAERKTAEKELKESEEKYRHIFQNTVDAIFIHKVLEDGTFGNFVEMNDLALQWTGYTREELLNFTSTDISQRTIQSDSRDLAQELISDGKATFESLLKTKDEKYIPVEINSHLFDLRGEKVVLSIARDITERKIAEEELIESEDKFRQIFHNAKDAFFIHKITKSGELGELIEINETACQWLGHSRDQLLDLLPPRMDETDKIKYSLDISDDLITADKTTFERIIENPAGDQIPVEFSSHLITLKGEEVLLSIARDITERKKAEIAITESEEKYRTLIETSPDAIIMINLDGRLSFANNQAAIMYGYDSVDDMIGLTMIDFVTREDLEYVDGIRKKVVNEDSIIKISVASLKRDGSRFPVQITSSLIHDNEENPIAIMGVIEDITERTKSETALKESEEKFRQAFDMSNDGIILHDLKGNILDVNLRIKEQIGYSKTEFLSLTIQQLHPVTELEASKEAFDKVQRDGSVQFETQFRRKDGSLFPADVSSSVFDIGGIRVIQGVVRDITERKKAEEELIEREEKFRQLFHNVNDAIFLTEINEELEVTENFIEVNDVACQILGYSKEELLDKKSVDITALEEKEANSGITTDIIRTGSKTFETILVTKDGIFIPVEVSSHVFTLKDRRVVLSVSRDISERKKAEKEIQESEERYRKVVETSPDGIVVTDLEGNIIVTNQQAAELYGLDEAEKMLGINTFELIAPEHRELAAENLQKTLTEGKLSSVEYTFLRKDGVAYPGELSASLIVDKDNNPFSFVGVIRDITERKKAEEELRENEEKYRLLFHNANDIIAVISVPRDGSIGKFLDVNDLSIEKLGYSRQEFLEMDLSDLIKDLTAEEVTEYFQELIEKKFITFERVLVKKDGGYIPVEINATPFTLHQELTVLITARDTTVRQRDEELKKQAYSQIEKNIEDFAILVDGIRNPLMSIIGYAELVETTHSGTMIEEAKKIEEITKKISDSYLETEQFRKILRDHLLTEEDVATD
ncbi:MAG: PAS domain S-box protein [Candidatus Heimdallarchaeota archaeon]|nr:PAS domain S-box protein [Candidatus Heimdallarchaeota archaeon]MCK4954849.1 PAS domain S-box protein [Candidatus Heimdallarchaeota archaeon]